MEYRVLFISGIDLVNSKGGGAIVLSKHLFNQESIEVKQIVPISFGGWLYQKVPIRLRKTRLSRFINLLRLDTTIINFRTFKKSLKEFHPNVVVTVAHGAEGWMAYKIASKLGLPLVTFFHDWWPRLMEVRRSGRVPSCIKSMVLRQFRNLYVNSDKSLCVCEGMLEELGVNAKAEVMFPMPGLSATQLQPVLIGSKIDDVKITITYAGNMTAGYGECLRALLNHSRHTKNIQFRLIGNSSDWCAKAKNDASANGVLRSHLPEVELQQAFADSDYLLVIMGFGFEGEVWERTSFPSKIASYSFTGKPIIFWGPPHSSIVRFARTQGMSLICTDKNPEQFLDFLDQLSLSSGNRRQQYIQETERLQAIFDPECIQKQFLEALDSCIND